MIKQKKVQLEAGDFDMEKFQIIMIIMIIGVVLLLIFGVFLIISSEDNAKETIERCKSKGWDGAKFQSNFAIGMICSNISQAEKDARVD